MPPSLSCSEHLFPALDIFDHFVDNLWQRSFNSLACRKGCSICCTDKVTVTEAEAARILTALSPDKLPAAIQRKRAATPCTTNEFAYACLHEIDLKPEAVLEPPAACPFLSETRECTIYPVRPLMCRLFISTVPCAESGEAAVPELPFLLQIVLQQVMEHVAKGTRWGNLITMLGYCQGGEPEDFKELRLCQEIPGFPYTAAEKKQIAPLLDPLLDSLKRAGWLPKNLNLDIEV